MPRPATDPVGMSWLVTVRWTTAVAGLGALAAGRSGLGASAPLAAGLVAVALIAVDWEHINRVLLDCQGNVSEAARVLGIHRRSLQRKLSKYPAPR